ncbi:hypothetical protein PL78_02025 [Yersinia entomophaga]|uniref:Lipoprotein n=1 Tax=Yersinia entomophaga TaxID=935293 RepID=A0ABM6BGZ9_YERET|nr:MULTISPECIES: hypothetical protein [Yersinia]ANI28614.1 hypothetical protein PL78_02025 [Yersinia entomophaga]OWF89840.1 hypothetical protein B4914_03040 [Yersinia entomophaga]
MKGIGALLLSLLLTGCGGTWFPEGHYSESREPKFRLHGDERTGAERMADCHRTKSCRGDEWRQPNPDYVGLSVTY